MESSHQSSTESPTSVAKLEVVCAMYGCTKVGTKACSTCLEVRYCSKKHQKQHWKYRKKVCSPQQTVSVAVPPQPSVSLKVEEVDDSDKCIICMDRVVNVKFKGCNHSMTCRECTDETIRRGLPCPLCRKPILGYFIGKFINNIGAHGLWPTSLKNLTQLAGGEGFNEYFQDLFVGNEAAYLRWKEVFDVLELVGVGAEGGGKSLEQQVLKITASEDVKKLRALAELCSVEFLNDPSLLVAVSRRILEVLVLAMPPPVEEKKVRGKKKKVDLRKVEVLDACYVLGKACDMVRDGEDARRYLNRAKEGYEDQLGPDSEKALEASYGLIMATGMSKGERIDKLKALLERMGGALGEKNVVTLETLNQIGVVGATWEELGPDSEKALEATRSLIMSTGMSKREYIEKLIALVERMVGVLGEENVVTLETLISLGVELKLNGEHEEARKVWERCLEGHETLLGEDHKDTLEMVNNLGEVYNELKDYEKALEYYERALKGKEKTLGKKHPETLTTVKNIAVSIVVYNSL
ncbi:hypothetical protein TrST_g11458 [Triparma strigata]|uniref:Uncharacterized protein n=1 Tax=Triparma strigata TaxID=1606541 RepID=A0A9W7A9P2_9STRA|nr:hypothetical protein TrST_g11458 [Triparma strigata]